MWGLTGWRWEEGSPPVPISRVIKCRAGRGVSGAQQRQKKERGHLGLSGINRGKGWREEHLGLNRGREGCLGPSGVSRGREGLPSVSPFVTCGPFILFPLAGPSPGSPVHPALSPTLHTCRLLSGQAQAQLHASLGLLSCDRGPHLHHRPQGTPSSILLPQQTVSKSLRQSRTL